MAMISSTMLNRSGKCGHPCLVLKFSGKTFNLSLLSMILSVGLSYFVEICSLYYAEIFFLYTHFDKSFYHEWMTFTCGSWLVLATERVLMLCCACTGACHSAKTVLSASPLYPSQPITGPSLCHHHPLWNHREWAVVEQLPSVIWAASGALFEEAPRVATATLPWLLVGNQLPLCPIVESFIQSWLPQIQCCSVTRSICSVWAGVFSQAVVGKLEDTRSCLSLPCLRGKPASSRVASVLFTALLCGPPTKQGGLSISCWTQKWCTKSAFWTAHSIG